MSKYYNEKDFTKGDIVYVSGTHSTRLYRIVDIRKAKVGEGWRAATATFALCEVVDGKPFRKKQGANVDYIFPEKKPNQNVYVLTQLTSVNTLEEQIKDTRKRLEFLLELQKTIEEL